MQSKTACALLNAIVFSPLFSLLARLDVTKQKDLSGFYRHLLNQAVGEEEVPKCSFREAR
jgi:hypothetical protein